MVANLHMRSFGHPLPHVPPLRMLCCMLLLTSRSAGTLPMTSDACAGVRVPHD